MVHSASISPRMPAAAASPRASASAVSCRSSARQVVRQECVLVDLEPDRGERGRGLDRKIGARHAGVHPGADHDGLGMPGHHFGEDAGELAAVEEHVVRPLEPRGVPGSAQLLDDGPGQRRAGDQRDPRAGVAPGGPARARAPRRPGRFPEARSRCDRVARGRRAGRSVSTTDRCGHCSGDAAAASRGRRWSIRSTRRPAVGARRRRRGGIPGAVSTCASPYAGAAEQPAARVPGDPPVRCRRQRMRRALVRTLQRLARGPPIGWNA